MHKNTLTKTLVSTLLGIAMIFANIQLQTVEAKSYFDNEDDIITRKEWGANESYRYLSNNDSTPQLIQIDEDFRKEFSNELKIVKTVKKDSSGNTYKWPYEYPKAVTKFIVHHTATTKDLDNPKQAIRNIYYYHAVTRGWGDIGYNYIIDQEGRVYEGRAGGDGVVGGHAGPGNIGSIGIAVLGNFEDDRVPSAVLDSLAKLIAIKSEKLDIDPTGKSSFRGERTPNVMGHNDVMRTACPGKNLDKKLATIARTAKNLMGKSSSSSSKYKEDYSYIDKSDISKLSLKAGEEKTLTIKFKNTGKLDWNEHTYLTLSSTTRYREVLEFPDRIGIRLANAEDGVTKSGKTATFKFKIKAKNQAADIDLEFAPVINSSKKLGDYKVLPVEIIASNSTRTNSNSTTTTNSTKTSTTKTSTSTISKSSSAKAYAIDPNKSVKNSELEEDDGGTMRVKISFNEAPILRSDEKLMIKNSKGKTEKTFKAGVKITLSKSGRYYVASTRDDEYKSIAPIKLATADDGVIEIVNMKRTSSYNSAYNDNKFRGAIEYQIIDGNNVIINELKLESYLKGLAEETNSTPIEKIKAIVIAARSYAKFYMHYADKFPGKPYYLEDDPATSQKYLGYGFESRAPNIVKAVNETKGEVITHDGQLVKAPYFTSDDGTTRSAYDVWKWDDPYLQSVEDPYCSGKSMAGHGVGMSGCGALGMANAGKSYKEILKYYYTGIEITKLW